MLFDTSAWVRFYRKPSKDWKPVDYQVENFIKEWVLQGKDVYTTPVIMQEVLQGFSSDKDFNIQLSNFQAYTFFELVDQKEAAIEAAGMYRKCLKAGYKINKPYDLLIALTVLTYDLPILYRDKDFDHIAKVYPIKTVKVA